MESIMETDLLKNDQSIITITLYNYCVLIYAVSRVKADYTQIYTQYWRGRAGLGPRLLDTAIKLRGGDGSELT